MKSNYRRIGDCIKVVDERNTDLKVTNLIGISISKEVIPSVANTVGTDMSKYKIIRKNQFACSTMQVRRDKKMPVALLKNVDEAIISAAYPVFEVVDENLILPEYLMMWFSRTEFDREACFYAIGGVRGSIEWEDFCNMQLPVPSIEKQREVVKEYNVLQDRISLNNTLIEKLEDTAQTIYKQWFVDFEFPDENGNSYKSNGGELKLSKELEECVPCNWEVKSLASFCEIKGGKRLPKGELLNNRKDGNPYIKVADMSNSKFIILNDKFQYVDEEIKKSISRYIVGTGDIIISIVGTIGVINVVHKSLNNANLTENCVKLTSFKDRTCNYLYHYLFSAVGKRIIKTKIVGGVQGKLPLYNIESIPILYPDNKLLINFERVTNKINSSMIIYKSQIVKLSNLMEILLSKLTVMEG